jgi:hypothetical protein
MSRARDSRHLLLVLSLLAIGALGFASGSGAAIRVGEPELYVTYTGANTVQVTLGGQVVRSGGSIPSGAYVVLVYDDGYNSTPRFLMSGPGVNISSDLNSTGMGVDGVSTFGPYNFPAGASYTVQQQGGPSVSFGTTASAGGASSGGSGGGSSAGSSGGTSGGSSSGTKSSTSVGSTGTKTMGTLKGSVSATGKGLLMLGGRIPKTLKAGRYTITVVDQSKKAGLVLGQTSKRPVTLSAASTTGPSSHSVTLSAGKWFFANSATGAKTYFTVTK